MGNVRENKEYFLGKKMELLISFAVRTSQKKKKKKGRKRKKNKRKKNTYIDAPFLIGSIKRLLLSCPSPLEAKRKRWLDRESK